MASLLLLKQFYKIIPSKLFVPAITNSEIMIGAITKYYCEHALLKNEVLLYNILYYAVLLEGFDVRNIYLPPELTLSSLTLTGLSIGFCYFYPMYRTFKAIKSNSIQIINLKDN